MEQGCTAEPRAKAVVLWQKAKAVTALVPVKAWIIFGLFMLAAVLMAIHTALAAKDASLRIKVQHSFRSAQLSVWIDGDLVYSGKLIGSGKKKFGLIPDSVQGTLSETLPVSAGIHQVRVRVTSDDGSVQEDTISGELARDSQRTLSIVARHDDVSLNWQGASSAAIETTSSSGWIGRYAGTLLLTIAGSIVSALAGYAIKELPKQIASRAAETPKL
jgi:hypothetical protein